MKVAAVVDTDGSYDATPGTHEGCFGWVDGTLYLGDIHHAKIIAGMIEAGQHTWETLMAAKQMWGWYEIESEHGYQGYTNLTKPCPECGYKSLIHELDNYYPQYSEITCQHCYDQWTPGDPEYDKLAPPTAVGKYYGSLRFTTDDAMQSTGVKGKVLQAFKEAFPFVNKWNAVGKPSTTQTDYGQRTRQQYFGEQPTY